jgi:hypothetical protein
MNARDPWVEFRMEVVLTCRESERDFIRANVREAVRMEIDYLAGDGDINPFTELHEEQKESPSEESFVSTPDSTPE